MPRYRCPRCGASNAYGGDPYPCTRCGYDGRVTTPAGRQPGKATPVHTLRWIEAEPGETVYEALGRARALGVPTVVHNGTLWVDGPVPLPCGSVHRQRLEEALRSGAPDPGPDPRTAPIAQHGPASRAEDPS